MDLKNLAIPVANLKIVSGSGLEVTAAGVTASIYLRWHYRMHAWPHVHDHGYADVKIKSGDLTISVRVGEKDGKPTVAATGVDVRIGELDIKLHGGARYGCCCWFVHV